MVPSVPPLPFESAAPPGVIDKDPPHGRRGHRAKVGATLPLNMLEVHQAQVGLMHELGRLKCMVASLSNQIGPRHSSKLVVHKR